MKASSSSRKKMCRAVAFAFRARRWRSPSAFARRETCGGEVKKCCSAEEYGKDESVLQFQEKMCRAVALAFRL